MLEIFQYSFVVRGMEAGIAIAMIAPLIGIFLVLRRYSLIADTLAHVSLAGVAIGLLLSVNPILAAAVVAVGSSVVIERLRASKKVYGESALAIFLSGSLALAVVLLGLAHGFNVDLFSYLFGSIVTVSSGDVAIIAVLGVVVAVAIALFFKEMVYISFDEEAAKVSGVPTNFINTVLIILSALTVAMAISIVGVLLISALVVIPVVSALQLKKGFQQTLLLAEVFSVFSVVAGIFLSFYLDLSTGGTIVAMTLVIFVVTLVVGRR